MIQISMSDFTIKIPYEIETLDCVSSLFEASARIDKDVRMRFSYIETDAIVDDKDQENMKHMINGINTHLMKPIISLDNI